MRQSISKSCFDSYCNSGLSQPFSYYNNCSGLFTFSLPVSPSSLQFISMISCYYVSYLSFTKLHAKLQLLHICLFLAHSKVPLSRTTLAVCPILGQLSLSTRFLFPDGLNKREGAVHERWATRASLSSCSIAPFPHSDRCRATCF